MFRLNAFFFGSNLAVYFLYGHSIINLIVGIACGALALVCLREA